jgi:dTDP-4-dehydrorhamnose 3,5-epimerase
MKVSHCDLEGIVKLQPQSHKDRRGQFMETYKKSYYESLGISDCFAQDNLSKSGAGVLRGLHFTRRSPQSQLLTVLSGEIFDVVVDIRPQSPTYLHWHGTFMGGDKVCQIYMPHGFAHGFVVLSDHAYLHYKVSAEYDPDDNFGLRWDDPVLAIDWPLKAPIVSERDSAHPLLSPNVNDNR